jgi:hypothetical protein
VYRAVCAQGLVVTLCAGAADAAAVEAHAAALGIQARAHARMYTRASAHTLACLLFSFACAVQVPLATLHQGALLAPDGARISLPAPPPGAGVRAAALAAKGVAAGAARKTGAKRAAAKAQADSDDDESDEDEEGDANARSKGRAAAAAKAAAAPKKKSAAASAAAPPPPPPPPRQRSPKAMRAPRESDSRVLV